ncbi:hypothetical protein CUU62_28290 [Pseudomonas sp. WP001]|nr:hypothetical protein CUU62_28290 [Pseudomonas sp. WP001]
MMIVPTLRVGMPPRTLRVLLSAKKRHSRNGDAERHGMRSHAEHGNDQGTINCCSGTRHFNKSTAKKRRH